MGVIESQHYRDEERRLVEDPILIGMADEILEDDTGDILSREYHEDGTPRHAFMGVCNEEYRRRGGTQANSLGAVARALRVRLLSSLTAGDSPAE